MSKVLKQVHVYNTSVEVKGNGSGKRDGIYIQAGMVNVYFDDEGNVEREHHLGADLFPTMDAVKLFADQYGVDLVI